MNFRLYLEQAIGWLFGAILFFMGFVNTFWGNDPMLGVGLIFFSFIYFPPVTNFIKDYTGIAIKGATKILLGMFLLWITLGVGELLLKIRLMVQDF